MAKYGIKNPIFKPSPITPTYNDYLIFEGISVDEWGKQYYLDVHIAYRQACLNAIEYLTKFGYSKAQAYAILGHRAGAGPHLRRGRHSQCLRDAVAADRHLRVRHHAERRRADQAHQGRRRYPDVAGQVRAGYDYRDRGVARRTYCRPGRAVGHRRSAPNFSTLGQKRRPR